MRTRLNRRNGRTYADYMSADTANLTSSRGWDKLDLLKFELSPTERAVRVEAYRQQVQTHGEIVAWLPPPRTPDRRCRANSGSIRSGRQRRWFAVGQLSGSCYSPAFVPGG